MIIRKLGVAIPPLAGVVLLDCLVVGCGSSDDDDGSGQSSLSCAKLVECYANCDRGDDACLSDCESRASSGEVEKANALLTCELNNCNGSKACTCNRCGHEARTCFSDLCSPSSCPEIYSCTEKCSSFDCRQSCAISAPNRIRDKYLTLEECRTTRCANAADETACLCQNCPRALNACFPNGCR